MKRLLPLLLLVACEAPPGGEPTPTPTATPSPVGPAFELGPVQACADPKDGWDRFDEAGADWGLTEVGVPDDDPEYPRLGFERMVVAEDVDGDGDVDLLIAGADTLPTVWLNEGDRFVEGPEVARGPLVEPDLFGLADLDGDRLPDLVGNEYFDAAWTAKNLGGGRFAEPVRLVVASDEELPASSVALGDADGDGDLDVLLVNGPEDHTLAEHPPSPFLLNDGGELTLGPQLGFGEHGVSSLGTTFFDRDFDGTPEILQPTTTNDFSLPTALWERDGDGWRDVAPELSADVTLAAMGVAIVDLNEDGLQDACISDVGRPVCLLSQPDGVYVEAGVALGLQPGTALPEGPVTVGWVMDFADLDFDGEPELLQASGYSRSEYEEGLVGYPDLLWSRPDADSMFEDVSAEARFALPEDHYGLAVADVDGDGWLDVVTAAPTARPRLFLNSCGAEAWVAVELKGPALNASALGAWVDVQAGGRTWRREVFGPRGSGQSPSEIRVGLGGVETIDRIVVHWPDGAVTEAEGIEPRRAIVARHPSLVE